MGVFSPGLIENEPSETASKAHRATELFIPPTREFLTPLAGPP